MTPLTSAPPVLGIFSAALALALVTWVSEVLTRALAAIAGP